MRHYMEDPENEDRLLKIPAGIVAAIKAEARAEVARGYRQFWMQRFIERHQDLSSIESIDCQIRYIEGWLRERKKFRSNLGKSDRDWCRCW